MTKWDIDVYDTADAVIAAAVAIDSTTAIEIIPFMEYGRQKFMLKKPGT